MLHSYPLAAKYNDLTQQRAALNQQRELYFDQASDPQIKQRMEQFQAEVAASSQMLLILRLELNHYNLVNPVHSYLIFQV
jgi:hypothetical protein